jgi:UDP-N-acetylglucosamine 2-epimerase (non-hydrolysing)
VTIRLGTNSLLGLDPARISAIPPSLAAEQARTGTSPPLWDGRAAERVADVLEEALVDRQQVAPGA